MRIQIIEDSLNISSLSNNQSQKLKSELKFERSKFEYHTTLINRFTLKNKEICSDNLVDSVLSIRDLRNIGIEINNSIAELSAEKNINLDKMKIDISNSYPPTFSDAITSLKNIFKKEISNEEKYETVMATMMSFILILTPFFIAFLARESKLQSSPRQALKQSKINEIWIEAGGNSKNTKL